MLQAVCRVFNTSCTTLLVSLAWALSLPLLLPLLEVKDGKGVDLGMRCACVRLFFREFMPWALDLWDFVGESGDCFCVSNSCIAVES